MLAAVVAAFALTPAIPPDPEPTDPPPNTYIVSGPAESSSTSQTAAAFVFSSDDPISYRCSLDGAAVAPCAEEYTTPALALGQHRLTVASRGPGGWDLSPAVRTWTVVPAPTPTPTATPTPDPTPVPTVTPPAEPTPAPVALIADSKPILAAPLEPIDISILYFMNAKKRFTRFATLSVKGVPAGATITVTCKGGCPRKTQTLTSAKGGTVRLASWLRQQLKTGATLTIAVNRAGMAGMSNTLTMRAGKRPRIVTKTLTR